MASSLHVVLSSLGGDELCTVAELPDVGEKWGNNH